jgi:uncharacterized protein YutE (UPF0331/DUF86 family)
MVDSDLVRRKVTDLDTYLKQLAEYRALDAAAYRADWKTQRIVERTLQLVVEICMDLADHIVSDRQLRVPDTGAAAFRILGEAGVLSDDLAQSLARMVRFRNILVHEYTKLDSDLVLQVLAKGLDDVRRFRDVVLRLL